MTEEQPSLLDSIELRVLKRKNVPVANVTGVDLRPPPALKRSIGALGIAEPVLVVQPDKGTEQFIVCDGNRRLAAAKALGLQWVPAVIYADNPGVRETLSLIGNSLRSNNPGHEAEQVRELVAKGLTVEQIASALHINKHTIAKRMRVAELPAAILDLLIRRKISEATALEIAKLDEEGVKDVLAKIKSGTRITRKMVREMREVGASPLSGLDPKFFGEIKYPVDFAGRVPYDDSAAVLRDAAACRGEVNGGAWRGEDAEGRAIRVRFVPVIEFVPDSER